MSNDKWADLGMATNIPTGRPVLRKDTAGHRYAAFRVDGDNGDIRVLDDRCPHQGYPLSQGEVRGEVLTCSWHNWKFDGCSGACLFGGEAVRSYPVRIEGERVLVDTTLDAEAERARLLRSMGKTLRQADVSSALRDAMRLSRLAGDGPGSPAAFAAIVADGARRAPYGFDHALAMTADLAAWAEGGLLESAGALSLAITAVAEDNANLSDRDVPGPEAISNAEGPRALLEDLLEERRDSAVARTRALVREEGVDAAVTALMPFISRHNLDYGHGAIFLTKAAELARRYPEHAEDLFGALAVTLSWATRDTSLPPWAATRKALDALDAQRTLGALGDASLLGEERRAYESAVLEGEKSATAETVRLLRAGHGPTALLRATARAAAHRMFRFDAAWERREESQVTSLNVSHTVTFAEAALALGRHGSPAQMARLAVLAAAFVGKVRKGDAPAPPRPAEGTHVLEDAVAARDVPRALAAIRGADRAAREPIFHALADHAAYDFGTRPIRYAHAIKMTEALSRLDRDDPEDDPIFLDSLVAFIVPRRPERNHRRIAEVARRFLDDPRPPPGLY